MNKKVQRIIDNFHYIFQPIRKPMLMARIARSFIRHNFNSQLEKRPIRNVDISINYRCNLSCDHCSCARLEKKEGLLTEVHLKKLAKEALELGAIYFSFTGGEILLNKNVEDIIQLFSPRSTLIGLQTNALLLKENRIKSLYKAGVDVVQVSLDSSDPEKHDEFRNLKGAYNLALKNVSLALKAGIKVMFCSTITHQDLRSDEAKNLLEFVWNKKIPLVLSIPCPVGKWTNDFSACYDDEDREYLKKLQKRYPNVRRDFDSNYSILGCSAATEKLYVSPYGDVIPCPFIHVSFGNIKEEPLSVIRDRMLKLDRFREYAPVCLAGEDHKFIDKYLKPTFDSKILPMKWSDHPTLKNTCGTGTCRSCETHTA